MEVIEVNELANKVAVVTAATRGIGKACALKLAEHGAHVYVASITIEEGQEVVDEIKAKGGQGKSIYFDARKPETYQQIIKQAVDESGKIDILVNNYGGTNPKFDLDVMNADATKFLEMVEDNIRSVYLPSQAAIPHMLKNGGSIVNISSIGSLLPNITQTAYGVSKAAINFLTKDIAVQYARNNIRCNAVLPGLTATASLVNNMSKEFIDAFLKHVPLNRAGQPEDIANAVLFLAGPSSAFITGEILSVAGGYGIPTPLYAQQIK